MMDYKKGGGLRSLAPIVDQTEMFLEKQNVPKDQVVPFLMSLGRPELAGAVADRIRLDAAAERMKAMQQGQSAPPTVVQENRAQAQGIAGMQPMQGAPVQNMYGGGMVALAGGGPIAFQAGGLNDLASTLGVSDRPIPYGPSSARPAVPGDIGMIRVLPEGMRGSSAFEELEELFKRAPDPSTKQIIIERAKQTLSSPAFKTWAGRVGLIGGAIPIGQGIYGSIFDDPAELAREYGMNPDKFGRQTAASGLAYLENVANIPTFGAYGMLRGETPQERVRARANRDERARNIETEDFASFMAEQRTPEQIAAQQEFSEAVREFGVNSRQAQIAEEKYRRLRGRASTADEAALDRLLAGSAGGRETSASQIGAPRLPGVPTTPRETEALTELRGRLKGMEDLSKPEAREAAIDREIAARMKRYTDMGILKPFDDAKANVQGRLKELEGVKDKNFYKAMAMMGFTVASTRGSFFQALAAGGAAGLSAYETFEDKRQTALDKLQDRMTNIDMSIANIKERAGAGAEARIDKLESDRKNLEKDIITIKHAESMLARTQAGQVAIAQMQIAADAARYEDQYGGLQRQIENEIMQLRELREKNPEMRAAIDARIKRKMDELTEAVSAKTGSVLAARVRADSSSNITGYPYPTIDSEKGGNDPYGINALIAQYGQ